MQEHIERINQVKNDFSDAPVDDASTRVPKLHAIALAWLEMDTGESEIMINDATVVSLDVGFGPSAQMDTTSNNIARSLGN